MIRFLFMIPSVIDQGISDMNGLWGQRGCEFTFSFLNNAFCHPKLKDQCAFISSQNYQEMFPLGGKWANLRNFTFKLIEKYRKIVPLRLFFHPSLHWCHEIRSSSLVSSGQLNEQHYSPRNPRTWMTVFAFRIYGAQIKTSGFQRWRFLTVFRYSCACSNTSTSRSPIGVTFISSLWI